MEGIKAKLEQRRLQLVPDMLELGEQILEADPIEQGLRGELDSLRQRYSGGPERNWNISSTA